MRLKENDLALTEMVYRLDTIVFNIPAGEPTDRSHRTVVSPGALVQLQVFSPPEGAELGSVGPGHRWNPSGAAGLR